MFLCLWLTLLLVVVGLLQLTFRIYIYRSLSKFNLHKLQCIQNSAARIVSNTSRYTSITPVLKKLHWLPVEQRTLFETATLVYSFLHTGFPRYFAPYLLPAAVLIVPGAVKVVVISLSFQSSTLLFINLSNSLVIVLLLMLPLCGILFQMRFVPLPPWPPSESTLKPTCTPKHTHLSLDHPRHSPWCLTPLMSLDTEILLTAFWFCCALESACMGRLSAIKVQLELDLRIGDRCKFVSTEKTTHQSQ